MYKGWIRAEKPLSDQTQPKTVIHKTIMSQKISKERMGPELDLGRMRSASVSRGRCTCSREGRKAQPVVHSPWAAFEGWQVAWVRPSAWKLGSSQGSQKDRGEGHGAGHEPEK